MIMKSSEGPFGHSVAWSVLNGAPRGAIEAYEAAQRSHRGRAAQRGRLVSRRSPPPAGRDKRSRGRRDARREDPEARFLLATGIVPLPRSSVRRDLLAVAERAAGAAARALRTTRPEVRWFRGTESSLTAIGWFTAATPGAIWVSADLSRASRISFTVHHESKHRSDHLAGRPRAEAAAMAFAERFALSEPACGAVTWTYKPPQRLWRR